jgi:hypothetical protein
MLAKPEETLEAMYKGGEEYFEGYKVQQLQST